MRHLGRLSDQRARSRLTDKQREELEQGDDACSHCGGYHARACPRVRRIEFHPNGVVGSVEFWRHDQIDWTGVVWTDDADDDADTDRDLHTLLSWLTDNKISRMPDQVATAARRLLLWRESAVQSEDAAPA